MQLAGMTWDHPRGYAPLVAAEAAAEADPGVSVSWDRRSLQDFEHFPLLELARKYDLIVMDHPHVGDAIASGAIVPMEELLTRDRMRSLRHDCLPVVWNSYVAEGKTWALPVDAATQVLIWRPGRLDHPPATWDEVVDLAGQDRVLLPLRSPHALMCLFSLLANLGHPFPEAGDPDPHALDEALSLLTLVSRHISDRCWSMDPIEAHDALAKGGEQDLIPLAYGYSTYGIAGFSRNRLRFGEFPGPNGPQGTTLGGTGLAVSRLGRDPKIAAAYAANMAGLAWQRDIVAPAGGQPSSLGAQTDRDVDARFNGFWSDTERTLADAWVRPRHAGYVGFQESASALVSEALRGTRTSRETAQALTSEFRRSGGGRGEPAANGLLKS